MANTFNQGDVLTQTPLELEHNADGSHKANNVARYGALAQSVPNNTVTIINYSQKFEDNSTAVTTGSAWKFIAPTAGLFLVNAKAAFSGTAWPGGSHIDLTLYKNNSLDSDLAYVNSFSAIAGLQMAVGGTTMTRLVSGDYIDVRVYQNQGTAIPLISNQNYNVVNIARIGT
jgi:hypothetical protein